MFVERPSDAKALTGVTGLVVRRLEAARCTGIVGRARPGAAASNVRRAAGLLPRATVRWRTLIVGMPAVGDELPDNAKHVVQAKSVGREAADGSGVRVIVVAAMVAPMEQRVGFGA